MTLLFLANLFPHLIKCVNTANASVIIVLPDGLETREINGDKYRKLRNRYSDVGQINNQYKGELVYRPDNNGVITYRDGRFYVSACFSAKKFSVKEIEDSNGIISTVDPDKYRFSYFGSFGYYFNRSMAVEFEYFDYIDSLAAIAPNIFNNIGEFSINTKNYMANFLMEINETKLVPFFGVGLGLANSSYSGYNKANNPVIVGKIEPLYQIILGIEFAVTQELLFDIRGKLHRTFSDQKINGGEYKIRYNNRYSFGLGFKYIL
ncbi:MAG: hypothetical protein LBB13_03965 [Rickettsiales bacterium]|nr:hypothetical protein [Rickettsiales bacterium]